MLKLLQWYVNTEKTRKASITYQKHQHEGPHIDDQEKEGDHGEGEDAPDPPVLPPTKRFIESVFNGVVLELWDVWFQYLTRRVGPFS